MRAPQAFSVDDELLGMVGTCKRGNRMHTLFSYVGIIGLFFSPCVARAQSADDPALLQAEIASGENNALGAVAQNADELAGKTENAVKDEVQRDVTQYRDLNESSRAVPTVDDSNASIEKDIESLESQAKALQPTK